MILICSYFFNLRDLKVILRLSSYGIYCLAIYIIFLFFLAVKSFAEGKISFQGSGEPNLDSLTLISCGVNSVLQAVGIYSLSFLVHNVVSPIIKANRNQKKNQRDVRLAYVLTTIVYITIGTIGDFGIFWRSIKVGGQTITPGTANVRTCSKSLLFHRPSWTCLMIVILSLLFFWLSQKLQFASNWWQSCQSFAS